MANQIYPPELQLNKANTTHTEAPLFRFTSFYCKWILFSKIYDKHNGFDFDMVNFPFLDGDVPRRASYGVYISFAKVYYHVIDFIARNKFSRQNFSSRDIGIINFEKHFLNFIVDTMN